MANIKYSDLLQYILPDLPGCSDPLVEQHLRSTVIDFCARAKLWRVFQDVADVVALQSEYDVDLPAGTSLVQILSATVDGAPISPATTDQLDVEYPRWRTNTGKSKWFLQLEPSTFFIAPVPDATIVGGLSLILAVKPARAATSFPDWIADQYHDALVSGTKARLMRQGGRPWANPQQAAVEQSIYDRAVATATTSAMGAMVRTAQRTTPQH